LALNTPNLYAGPVPTALDEPPIGRELGRPRNAQLDKTILQAVRELLAEEGYQSLSANKVTQRSGVHVRTIARRWDSKAEMVAAAILDGDDDPSSAGNTTSFPTGSLKSDLRELIRRNMAYLSDPATRAAFPALLAELGADARAEERFVEREREWEAIIAATLQRAVESGEAPERVLRRSQLVPTVLGSVTFMSQFQPWASSADILIDELAEFVLAALLGP
jgi:AcrR family transcriptional regulator